MRLATRQKQNPRDLEELCVFTIYKLCFGELSSTINKWTSLADQLPLSLNLIRKLRNNYFFITEHTTLLIRSRELDQEKVDHFREIVIKNKHFSPSIWHNPNCCTFIRPECTTVHIFLRNFFIKTPADNSDEP